MDTFILTNNETYTPTEVIDYFSEHVKPENVEILVNHLTIEDLAKHIISFIELDGDVCFNIGYSELLRVKRK